MAQTTHKHGTATLQPQFQVFTPSEEQPMITFPFMLPLHTALLNYQQLH